MIEGRGLTREECLEDALENLLFAMDRQYMNFGGRKWSWSLRVQSAMSHAQDLLDEKERPHEQQAVDVMSSEPERSETA